jgi:signal-transduction protein with cAMP-binding, CBS, and nucleotidyltransferase domain
VTGVAGGDAFCGNCTANSGANILERFRETQKNPRATHARQICTVKPLEVGPDMTIIEAANLLVAENNDYLVVHENDAMVGHLTSIDVLKAMMEDGKRRRDDLAQRDCAANARAQASLKRAPI